MQFHSLNELEVDTNNLLTTTNPVEIEIENEKTKITKSVNEGRFATLRIRSFCSDYNNKSFMD